MLQFRLRHTWLRFYTSCGLGLGPVATCILMLAGCAPGADLPSLPEATSETYRLGSGDQVRVITFGEQQLTGEFRVSDSGNIAVPLLGVVAAAGLTPGELGNRIAGSLQEKKLFSHPSVSVEVIHYRPIFVLGEVAKPGEFPYQPGMTMLTAVAVAGGFTYRAVQQYASDVRLIERHAVEGRIDRKTVLQPGDVVTIYERIF